MQGRETSLAHILELVDQAGFHIAGSPQGLHGIDVRIVRVVDPFPFGVDTNMDLDVHASAPGPSHEQYWCIRWIIEEEG